MLFGSRSKEGEGSKDKFMNKGDEGSMVHWWFQLMKMLP